MEGGKTILVTGASSGFGRGITERLTAAGHFVYAGARAEADLHRLAAIQNVQALRLDVTRIEDIVAAVDQIQRGGRGLYGLVNNAGVLTVGPVANGNESEFDLMMAVNVYGPYRVTKALAPLILAEKGRIVTIGSIAGIRAVRNAGAYSMSKHAIEAFTDSLAEEMESAGVQVSVVEPGSFNTRIAENAMARIGVDSRLLEFSAYKEPDCVINAVMLALFEINPKRRYLVASNEEEARRTIEKEVERLVQLNERHPYTYDRNTLIRMLDGALRQSLQTDSQPDSTCQ